MCSNASDDTWESLATIAGMQADEYLKWVRESDGKSAPAGKPEQGKTYFVPNTIYVTIGPDYEPDTTCLGITISQSEYNKFKGETHALQATWAAKGFLVLENDQFSNYLKSDYVYGFIFNGHGAYETVDNPKSPLYPVYAYGGIIIGSQIYQPIRVAKEQDHKFAMVNVIPIFYSCFRRNGLGEVKNAVCAVIF